MPANIDHLYRKVESEDGLDRLLPLESIVENAQVSGGLQEMPDSDDAFQKSPDLIRRMKVRLYHLGYLKKLRTSADLNIEESKAIKAFQEEAGIAIDGWVGSETWTVMDNLFSFEAESHIERWTANEVFLPLLQRAVQLRLFAFSLLKVAPSEKLVDPMPGLKRFVKLANTLGFIEEELETDYSFKTLDLLFDQDRITEGIASLDQKIDLKKNKAIKSFIVCNAKIELWLLGYSIKPDGKGVFKKPPRRRRRAKRPPRPHRYQTFYKVLRQFCNDVNPGRSKRLSAGNFGSQFLKFFQEFAQAHESGPAENQTIDSNILVEAIQQNPEAAMEEWKNYRSFAGRLWDGVKRAWGWLKRLFRKAIDVVTSLVRNAVRVVWSLAVHSVGIIKAAINSFPSAVTFFLNRQVKGSNQNSLVYSHDHDFDWRVFVRSNPNPDSFQAVLGSLREQVVRFTFSVRLVGVLIKALYRSLRILPSGYLALFLAISRIQSALEPFLDYYQNNRSTLHA